MTFLRRVPRAVTGACTLRVRLDRRCWWAPLMLLRWLVTAPNALFRASNLGLLFAMAIWVLQLLWSSWLVVRARSLMGRLTWWARHYETLREVVSVISSLMARETTSVLVKVCLTRMTLGELGGRFALRRRVRNSGGLTTVVARLVSVMTVNRMTVRVMNSPALSCYVVTVLSRWAISALLGS